MNWLKLSNKKTLSFAFAGFCVTVISAQNPLQEYQKQYPDFNELVLKHYTSYDLSIDHNKLKIIQNNQFESIILSQHGIQNDKESISHSDLVKLISSDAYSVVNENGKEKKFKVTEINKKSSQSNTVFYDDLKDRQFIFPNLEAGAKKIYKYQVEFQDPYLLHKFVFGNGYPTKDAKLEIQTDENIDIGYKIFNDPNNLIEFSKTKKNKKWIYQWALKDIKPVKMEENAPGPLYILPHLDIFIKNYTTGSEKIEILGDVNALFNYYKGFVDKLNKKNDPVLEELSKSLTIDKSTESEKLKAILYWVKDNIKYIAFENGYEGFIPREASLVFERKFGDCKDMASLITCMAKYAGIPNVSLAWIGTRALPYTYEELPTPSTDNHMIAVYNNGNEYIFLDGTDSATQFGLPSSFIQGKEALFNENDNYKIITIPIVEAEKNLLEDIVKLSIDKGKLTGSGKITMNGFSRSNILAQIGDAERKIRFEMIKSVVEKGNNKFNLKEYSEENVANRDLPYIINYTFDLDNYIIKAEKELYLNLFLDKYYENKIIENDRLSKYELEYLPMNKCKYEVTIPNNYKLKYLPKNFFLDNALMKITIEYQIKNNLIYLNFDIKLKKDLLDPSDFKLWNDNIKNLKNQYNESLILIEK